MFNKAGSGTTISMSDGWGKASRAFSISSLAGVYGTAYPGDFATAELMFLSDGTITYSTSDAGTATLTNWTTPTTAGIGSGYWVRFTQTGSFGTGGFGGATQYGYSKGAWHQISNNPYFGVSRTANGMGGFYYDIAVASDSGGSNIVASTSGAVTLGAEIIF